MALRRRFLPVFKKHAPRGKPRFAKPLQGHFGPAAKHSQKHKNRPKIGRFSHFNPSAEMHPFSLFSASKAPQKWLCDAICRKKQLFAGSFGSRSHSFCSFTICFSPSLKYHAICRKSRENKKYFYFYFYLEKNIFLNYNDSNSWYCPHSAYLVATQAASKR